MENLIREELYVNHYNLNEDQWEKIKYIIRESYIKIVDEVKLCGEMKIGMIIAYIVLIAENYENLDQKRKWDKIIYEYVKEIKKRIEEKNVDRVSLLGGLAEICVAINNLVKKTGNYINFLEQLNAYLLSEFEQNIDVMIRSEKRCYMENYDTISGVSGWVTYLLEYNLNDESKKIIQKMLVYLLNIVKVNHSKGNDIPGWYIANSDLPMSADKKNHPNGCVNYSYAHGIGGILAALSIAYYKGITINGQKEAIEVLVREFQQSAQCKNDIYYWPGMLSLDQYLLKNYVPLIYRGSWCYGNIGILCCLYHASVALKVSELDLFVKQQMDLLLNLNVKDYCLESAIICHGFSGIVLFFYWLGEIYHHNLQIKLTELVDAILSTYDNNLNYGFFDVYWREVSDNYEIEKRDNLTILDGTFGCIATLLVYVNRKVDFHKYLGFITN